MKKWAIIFICIVICGFSSYALAGGIDNKQNFSAAYAATGSRNAALEGGDIAAYNPAGLAHLKDGTHLEVDTQFLYLDYAHEVDGRDYGLTHLIKCPTTFITHKKGKWAAYGTFTINGGGGDVEYEDGNSITKGLGYAISAGKFGHTPGGSLDDEYAYSQCYYYTFTAGGAYTFSDQLSMAGGLRYIITDKEVEIHGTYSIGNEYILGKYAMDAKGWGGVLSLNYKHSDQLNLSLRYETIVKLDWDTEVDENSRGTVGEIILTANGRVHGQTYARDLPAVLALGAEYKVLPDLTLAPSFTYYFEKDADMDTQNAKVDKNSYDLGLAARYHINESWAATLGYMYTNVGIDADDFGIIEKMNPPLDCHTVNIGGQYKMNEKWMFTMGLMGSFYVDDSAKADANGNPPTTYKKTVTTLAIGVNYTFL